MRAEQAKSCSSGLTDPVVGATIHKMEDSDWAALSPIQQSLPPVNSPEGRTPTPPTASHLPMEPLELQGPPVLRSLDDLILVPSSPEEGACSAQLGTNQLPAPEVQQEVEQQALLTEIREVIEQEYLRYILRRSPFMRNSAFLSSPKITEVAQLMLQDFELELQSIEELQQFIQDIRANPQQLNSEFKKYWGS